MSRDTEFPCTMRWTRVDAFAIFVLAVGTMAMTQGPWGWFLALFLVPDLSMTGYLFGRRAGAVVYNTVHVYAWPLAICIVGFARGRSLLTTAALSWIAHIALDQALGYGLKLPTGFERTTLGPIGRTRRELDRA
jgi:hypothetical protein